MIAIAFYLAVASFAQAAPELLFEMDVPEDHYFYPAIHAKDGKHFMITESIGWSNETKLLFFNENYELQASFTTAELLDPIVPTSTGGYLGVRKLLGPATPNEFIHFDAKGAVLNRWAMDFPQPCNAKFDFTSENRILASCFRPEWMYSQGPDEFYLREFDTSGQILWNYTGIYIGGENRHMRNIPLAGGGTIFIYPPAIDTGHTTLQRFDPDHTSKTLEIANFPRCPESYFHEISATKQLYLFKCQNVLLWVDFINRTTYKVPATLLYTEVLVMNADRILVKTQADTQADNVLTMYDGKAQVLWSKTFAKEQVRFAEVNNTRSPQRNHAVLISSHCDKTTPHYYVKDLFIMGLDGEIVAGPKNLTFEKVDDQYCNLPLEKNFKKQAVVSDFFKKITSNLHVVTYISATKYHVAAFGQQLNLLFHHEVPRELPDGTRLTTWPLGTSADENVIFLYQTGKGKLQMWRFATPTQSSQAASKSHHRQHG